MKRGAPLKRTPFQRKTTAENIPKKVAQSYIHKAQEAIKCIAKTATFYTPINEQFRGSIPKSQPVRSEAYRRVVASLPCFACGIQGHSQAAHLPPEGKGLKQCDLLTFPLCCVRVGIPGCHQDYDQYRMFKKRDAVIVGSAWAADTQRKIRAMGKWPADLPMMIENDPTTEGCP